MRGVYVAGPSFGIVAGIFIGYFACYGTERIPSSAAWRTPYIIQGLLALILRISCLLLPASPRWLVLHGHESKAMEAVERLGLQKEEAEKDILAVKASEHQQLEVSSLGALIAIFQKQYRSQTMLGLFVLGMVQLSGIDGILFVSILDPWIRLTLAHAP